MVVRVREAASHTGRAAAACRWPVVAGPRAPPHDEAHATPRICDAALGHWRGAAGHAVRLTSSSTSDHPHPTVRSTVARTLDAETLGWPAWPRVHRSLFSPSHSALRRKGLR